MISLIEDELGELVLDCAHGYVVSSLQIGSPNVREVVHDRALTDGTVDDTTFVGSRAITVAMTLDTDFAPMQTLLDQLIPYVSPRRRPILAWSLPGSEADRRALIVRGVDAPFVLERPRFPPVVCQWVAPDGLIVSPQRICETITPASDEIPGRTYDECPLVPSPDRIETGATTGRCYDRDYPPAGVRGGQQVITHGNSVTDWQAALYGPITNPTLTVNGTTMVVTTTLALGQSIVVDTRERTILRNGDPTDSLYGSSNFSEWTWDQLRLRPGINVVRYSGADLTPETSASICWRDTWR